jgi:hypothetical protein
MHGFASHPQAIGSRPALIDEDVSTIHIALSARRERRPGRHHRRPSPLGSEETGSVVSFLLSVTFACGLVIAISHVINQRFVAPAYDVVANLTAFGCAVGASLLLGHWIPASLSAIAILCWLMLARRTILARRTADREVEAVLAPSEARG